MEIEGRLEKQRTEKFFLQRRERKGCMADIQWDPETGDPLTWVRQPVL
jgi:hypothetical protein